MICHAIITLYYCWIFFSTFSLPLLEKLLHPWLHLYMIKVFFVVIAVTAAWREPFEGWVDNVSGITGIMMEIGRGAIRSIICDQRLVVDIIPVDLVVNTLISAAWHITEYRYWHRVRRNLFLAELQLVNLGFHIFDFHNSECRHSEPSFGNESAEYFFRFLSQSIKNNSWSRISSFGGGEDHKYRRRKNPIYLNLWLATIFFFFFTKGFVPWVNSRLVENHEQSA